ncbi:hypothetical protein [Bradyrhizobium sp. CCBAU 45384]|uniref:hypothetical protein n=1 Tax=Bradyrhizobium sp. CCBAU 45384 TaxID=858428 RepID=UPI0023067135|nr:hypothetical protein [Bradyrhizobium sp. CCBAU 45384]MDA9409985.1 hypothetical protein [Bradyrhizobium sp. CCBAU 45384]
MASISAVLDAIEQHLKFPRSRSAGVARRLQEARLLPTGVPSAPPELDEDQTIDLVVALASDVTLHEAPDAVRAFHRMTPGGVNLEGAPQTIPNAPIAVSILVEDARAGVAEARKAQIAVSCNWRALAIHMPGGDVQRFCEAGQAASHWQSGGHHRSTTLNVAAIADALDEIFGKAQA